MRGWIISHDEYYLERVETHRGKFRDALNEIRALADTPEQLQRVDVGRARRRPLVRGHRADHHKLGARSGHTRPG